MAAPDPSGAPLHLGKAEQGSPSLQGIASAAPKSGADVPGVPSGAAQGGLEPRECGDPLGGPQPRLGEGQPTAQGGRPAVPPRVAAEPGGGKGRADPPLVEEPPGQEGDYGTEEAAEREGAKRGRGSDLRAGSAGRLHQLREPLPSRPPTSGRGANQVTREVRTAGGISGS